MKSALRKRGIRAACACILLSAAVICPEARASLLGQSFHQLNWYNQSGALVAPNSLWGQVSFEYTAPASIEYLNIFLSNTPGSTGVWAVQNLPLFPEDDGIVGSRTEGIYLDLSDLGISPQQNWSQSYFSVAVDSSIRTTPLLTGTTPESVGDVDFKSWDSPDELDPQGGSFTDPGRPAPKQPPWVPTFKPRPARDIRGIQEDGDHCFAGATTRSLDWLNRKHQLNFNRTISQIYSDLKDKGVSKKNPPDPETGKRPKAREQWIKAKDTYAREKSGNIITTKVWDSGGWLDPIAGVSESSGNFIDWLKSEWSHGEDVELIYNWPDGGHIVTLADFYWIGDSYFVKYRDDEDQDNPLVGDGLGGPGYPAFKRAILVEDNGAWCFDTKANKITWAVSESVPEPLSGGLVMFLGLLAGRKRAAR